MRRGAVPQSFEQEAETQLLFFGADTQQLENLALDVGAVNADAAAAQLGAVEHQIVALRADFAQVAVEQRDVFVPRRGEGVVHRVPELVLFVELEHMDTGTTVTLIDQPGVPGIDAFGCEGENIRAYLDDEAALPIENECGPSTPTIEGAFKPNSPLSAFDGESFDGEWQLRIYDLADDDLGEVVGATIWLE